METIFNFLFKGLAKKQTLKNLESLKRKTAKKYRRVLLSNSKLLKEYHNSVQKGNFRYSSKIEKLLIKRPTRSLSGVSVVSALTKPYPCPGNCLFCPSEPGMPKSYLSNEPAAMRAKRCRFNPYKQTFGRIRALKATGHPIDKIELIVIGGSWTALPQKYRQWFIKRCFDACNGKNSKTLEKAKKINEKSKSRIVGLTLETRPDMITKKEVASMRQLGATRVELGVQSVFPVILDINRRGHGLEEISQATKILKDAGFKICYHMMVNLPGSNPKKDLDSFKIIFSDNRFQPDLLKIYPCAIVKGSELDKLYQQKKYKPYSLNTMQKLLKKIKLEIPYYCRIQRLVRDIPSQSIEKGPAKNSNMRQEIQIGMARENKFCKCIRCREPRGIIPKGKLKIFR